MKKVIGIGSLVLLVALAAVSLVYTLAVGVSVSGEGETHCEQAWEAYNAPAERVSDKYYPANPTGMSKDTYIKRCKEGDKVAKEILDYGK